MAQVSTYQVAARIQFGIGSSDTVGQEARGIGARHAFIMTDKGVVGAGLLERIAKSLMEAGVALTVFDEVLPDPRAGNVNRAASVYSSEGCDLLVAVGGGSVIDCAKATGIVLANGGTIEDYFPPATRQIEKHIPPLIAIPTTAGTGSEVSTGSVITDDQRHNKVRLASGMINAEVALLDPELTRTLPQHLTAITGLDALSHGTERFTAKGATPLTDVLALGCIRLVAGNLRQAYADGDNLEARANMQWAALLGGMCRAPVTSAHAIATTLGSSYGVPHGLGCAILQPHCMEFNLISNPPKFAAIAEAMGERIDGLSVLDAAYKSVYAVKRLLVDVGVTQRLRDLNVPEEDIPTLAEATVSLRQSALKANPRRMTAQDVEAVIRRCY